MPKEGDDVFWAVENATTPSANTHIDAVKIAASLRAEF
jgi:hypothetical protein